MSMKVMRSLILRSTSQVGRGTNMLIGFTSSMTQRTTFRLMNLLSITRDRRRSRHWQVMSVSLTRITKTSPLHRKSYSDGTLDLDILNSNISKWLIRTGRLKLQGTSKAVANCESPKCAACECVKGRRWRSKVNKIKKNHMKDQELKKYHLMPGQMVSAHNYI